jgi:hypothetical protein
LPPLDRQAFAAIGIHDYQDLPRGCIVGKIVVAECLVSDDAIPTLDATAYRWGDYTPARYAWRLASAQRIVGVPPVVIGRQGFFPVAIPEGAMFHPDKSEGSG